MTRETRSTMRRCMNRPPPKIFSTSHRTSGNHKVLNATEDCRVPNSLPINQSRAEGVYLAGNVWVAKRYNFRKIPPLNIGQWRAQQPTLRA